MMEPTMTETRLISFAGVLATMSTYELEYMFRFIAIAAEAEVLDNINGAMRRVCIEQENLRLTTLI
jgi:hypothetical protein